MNDDWEPFSESWNWRQHVAHWIHEIGFWFSPSENHELIIRDSTGDEFFSVFFEGDFSAWHPPSPYTVHCRHSDGEEIDLS